MIPSFSEVTEGYYYVRPGDTARSVAGVVYGDKNRYAGLLKANPEIWNEGDLITVPGVSGRVANIHTGESATRLISRIFPNQPVHLYQNRFYAWNGGAGRKFEGGEVVFIPNR
jgi:hypothetical protein